MLSKLKSFLKRSDVMPGYFDELEEILLASDAGADVTEKIVGSVRDLKKMDDVRGRLYSVMTGLLKSHEVVIKNHPHVIMVVGVNGGGKTTTIAKLAHRFKKDGKSVLLVAADTFRAAAILQLKVWGDRLNVPVAAQKPDSDPAAVAFDGIKSGVARGVDVIILDTAGRLHTNKNLMDELSKVKRVSAKAIAGAPHDILMVVDATVGQNGLNQAASFNEALGLTGIVLAKMDGTAKGGIIFSVSGRLGLPVSYVGTGEALDDLELFRPDEFVMGIIGK